ncbi:DUF4116 domain-containing protein [Endozoicomonas sp. ALD040]|uniref:DUF4116 domain-containing protein n=1 Tax=Endozoicomonas sp. ALD040 TaxID=3403079 RepID=UPI003BB212F8
MLPATAEMSDSKSLTRIPNHNIQDGSPSIGTDDSPKRYFGNSDPGGAPNPASLARRTCRPADSGQAADCSPSNREQFGGKGMFLQRMKKAGLSVPPFECVTAQVMNALEQHPLDRLDRYLPGIDRELKAETSLKNIRDHLNALPPSEQSKRDKWLQGLAQFVASDDYYEQVKDSEAAREIRGLLRQLDRLSTSQPVIVRSSGINEDNYGDSQAGKYLSVVQAEEDILRTCLKVMASGYRPEVCPEVIPPPMALIIQECIDCQYGGVAMSFQSFQDNTVRAEFTLGQPRGVVAGQSGNTPHRLDIYRKGHKEEVHSYQYFPGTLSSHFVLHKNNNGYSEVRIDHVDAQSGDGGLQLTDETVSELMEAVTKLEDLLLCPVDVEFAIDRQGRLFLLQVRPVTRLSGGMDFAMPIPEETLASGQGISEGYCTGTLWLAEEQAVDSMPEGAIVVADHAEDWMLEPEFLKRVRGVVFAKAGFNDHVAILMRQEKITLMRADDQFSALAAQKGQQTTLACARFNGEPVAFVVAGDLTEKLASHRSLSSAFSDMPLGNAVPSRDDLSPSEDTLRQVANCFQWLTDQNARLLAFFASGGGLDCLANPIKLSMSRQRSELLAETRENIKRLIYGAEKLLEVYQAFLQLAGNSSSSLIETLRDELPQLNKRFETLKQTIQSGLENIIMRMQAAEDGQLSPLMFRQWVVDCHQLQSCLQALNFGKAEQVRSVHELIFALHQRFVEALAAVTLGSGQGRLSKQGQATFVDCTTPGKSGEKAPLLTPFGKESIGKSANKATVISMNDALIVNLKLGSHVGLVELLEQAEGGKGRTLRLKFSDKFRKHRASGLYNPGKLKRMWFLAQLLRAIELGENTQSMKLSCNEVAGEMIVECSRIKSRPVLQGAFEKLITVLNNTYNLDQQLSDLPIFEGDQWDFNLLAQRLNRDITTEADRFAFHHCLFSMFYDWKLYIFYKCLIPCDQLLNNQQQRQFIDHCRRLGKSERHLEKVLMSDEIGDDSRRELLQHLLLIHPEHAVPLFAHVYPHLEGQYYVIKPSFNVRLEFDIPPGQPVPDDKEKVRNVLLLHGLKYASQRVRSDKEVVLPTIRVYPGDLKYVSTELKNDKEVVMAAVTQKARQLQYTSPELLDNKEVVMAAVSQNGRMLEYASATLRDDETVVMAAVETFPQALRHASERLRGDKKIIQFASSGDVRSLYYASETLLNDREYMLGLIEQNCLAFEFAASRLQMDYDFINAATIRNPAVFEFFEIPCQQGLTGSDSIGQQTAF